MIHWSAATLLPCIVSMHKTRLVCSSYPVRQYIGIDIDIDIDISTALLSTPLHSTAPSLVDAISLPFAVSDIGDSVNDLFA